MSAFWQVAHGKVPYGLCSPFASQDRCLSPKAFAAASLPPTRRHRYSTVALTEHPPPRAPVSATPSDHLEAFTVSLSSLSQGQKSL